MTDEQLEHYMYELTLQRQAAGIAGERLNATLVKLRAYTPENLNGYVFADVQSLLSTGALISKLLWPMVPMLARGRKDEESKAWRAWTEMRGQELRRALRVTTMPILESRGLRNAFEHFDTELDQVLRKRKGEALFDFSLMHVPPERAVIDSAGVGLIFLRIFRVDTGSTSVLDHEVDTLALSQAIEHVGKKAQRWLDDRKQTLHANS